MQKIYIDKNWQYRQAEKYGQWQHATVPGNIHLDLMASKVIADPYYRLNERAQQWIGETDWEYRAEFELDSDFVTSKHIDLVFAGLDTYADIYLNDMLIGKADNMYCGWRFDVKPHTRAGLNELRIYFHSVIKTTLPLFEQNGFEYGANNSQPEPKLSMYTRKPGYHFGWDWGPRLLTCGVWRPVYLEAWQDVRLDNVRFVQKSLSDAVTQLQLEVEIISVADATVALNLATPDDFFTPVKKEARVVHGTNKVTIDFEIASPKKWWCNGLGKAFLYELNLDVSCHGAPAGAWHERVGLRTVELVHEADEHGKSFYFKLNGVPVFIKGSNCIPMDYFVPRVKKQDYRRLLQNALAANMNMLRLWGGAIYEEDTFYDLCDEMGILIWQDFMFACAMYPADEVMQRRIRQEAEYNVKRLRHHACLALWCGNNEIDEGWHTWGWQQRYNYSLETCDKIWGDYCTIFHEILPEVVKQFDAGRPYWPSSPKYGFVDPKSRSDGDMHYWGVWFLNHPREKFKEYLPRFMSEYGLQSMPEMKTFRAFSVPEDWDLKSDVMQAHQRQYSNPRKGQLLGGYDMLLKYLESEYHVPPDFELLAYVSQLLQADYLRYAIETYRRNRPYCMGSMYWQLNDLWPVTSWATIDYYGRWKAGHYAVQQAYRPVLVSTSDEGESLRVFIVNDLLQERTATLAMQLLDFDGNIHFSERLEVSIPPGCSLSCFEISKKALLDGKETEQLVWIAQLVAQNEVLSENKFYFNYLNRLQLKEPEIKYTIQYADEAYQIKLCAKKLAKNVQIVTPATDGALSENFFDLLPGGEKVVVFRPDKAWDEDLKLLHYYRVLKR